MGVLACPLLLFFMHFGGGESPRRWTGQRVGSRGAAGDVHPQQQCECLFLYSITSRECYNLLGFFFFN